MRVTIMWLCMVFVENVSSKAPPNMQRLTVEPQNTTVLIGSRLALPCRVKDRRGVVQWTKNDFGLGDKRNLPEYERYRMTGNDEEDFTLEINPVTIEDEDKFQCQVGFSPEGHQGIQSQYAWVTVIIPPKPPRISQGNLIMAPEGLVLPLECVSEGGKPAPELDWRDEKGKRLLGASKKVSRGPENTFKVKSILWMKVDRRLHNTTITCRAKNEAVPTYLSTNVLFRVLYPPEVHVEKTPPSEWVSEGSDVTFSCRAKGNPSEFKFEWSVEEKVMVEETKSILVLENVPRELNGVVVKCRVENAVGRSTGSATLFVGYGPSFRSPLKSIAVEVGSVVAIHCDAVGNPSPAITWLHNNTVVGTSSDLTLLIQEDSGGIYTCKALVPGFPEIQAEHGILMKGRPIVVISGGLGGDVSGNVRLKCIVFSTPPSPQIIWTFEGAAIDKNDQNYFIREKVLPSGVESTLTFSRSKINLYGTYNCSVRNAYGTSSAEKIVEIQDDSQIRFAGVVGGVVMVAAIVISLCAFFRCKNHFKPNFSNAAVKRDAPVADCNLSKNKTEAPLPDTKNTTLLVPSVTSQPNHARTDFKDSGLPWNGKTDPITDNSLTTGKDSEYLVTNGLYDYNWSFQPDDYLNNDVWDRQLRNPFRHLTTGPPPCRASFFRKGFPELGRYSSVSPKYENTKFGMFFTAV